MNCTSIIQFFLKMNILFNLIEEKKAVNDGSTSEIMETDTLEIKAINRLRRTFQEKLVQLEKRFMFHYNHGLKNTLTKNEPETNLKLCKTAWIILNLMTNGNQLCKVNVNNNEPYYTVTLINNNRNVVEKKLHIGNKQININNMYGCRVSDSRIDRNEYRSIFVINSAVQDAYFIAYNPLKTINPNNVVLTALLSVNISGN